MGLVNLRRRHLLVAPVAHQGLVHLPEDGAVLAVDPVQFLVGAGAQVGVVLADVGHQFAAGQFLDLAVHLQLEDVAVGDES